MASCHCEAFEVVAADFAKQLAIVEVGLQSESDNINLLSSRSRALIRLGSLEDASSCLELLLRIDPKYSVGHYDLACLHALFGRRELMLAALAEAIRLLPDWMDFAKGDPDFADFWTDADWRSLVYRN